MRALLKGILLFFLGYMASCGSKQKNHYPSKTEPDTIMLNPLKHSPCHREWMKPFLKEKEKIDSTKER